MNGKVPNAVENIAENLNRLSRAHERYRQTTDGRAIAYSERVADKITINADRSNTQIEILSETYSSFVTSAKEDVQSSLFVSPTVSNFVQKKNTEWICVKFSRKVDNEPMNKRLNFSGDPFHGSGSGSGSRHW